MKNRNTQNKHRSTLRQRHRKIPKSVKSGRIYVRSTFNNVNISLTDNSGNVIAWSSAGNVGFKGTKKATPFAATQTAKNVIDKAKELGMEQAQIIVSGVGNGREAAVRAFAGSGITITSLRDATPIPHNGCRPKKPRRI